MSVINDVVESCLLLDHWVFASQQQQLHGVLPCLILQDD